MLLFFLNTTKGARPPKLGVDSKPLVTRDKAYLEGKGTFCFTKQYSTSSNNKWDVMQNCRCTKLCRKFHRFCNSIAIWSEIYFEGRIKAFGLTSHHFQLTTFFVKYKLLLPVLFFFTFETPFWTKTRLIHFKANLNQMQNWFDISLVEFNQVKTLSFPKTATLSTFNFSKLWQHQNVHSKQIEELISVDASEFANFPAIWSNTG